MKSNDIIYITSQRIGLIDNNTQNYLDKEKRDSFYQSLEKSIGKKDANRKLSSLVSGCAILVVAIVLLFLVIFKKLGNVDLFTYTFIFAGLILVWVLLYFLLGFIFYSKVKINYCFKSKKELVNYASSNYRKFIEQNVIYLKRTNFTINKTLVPFCLSMPSPTKNIIFNGKVSSNVPYYYLSIKQKRILFLPGITILINKKETKVIPNEKLKATLVDNVYSLDFDNINLCKLTCNNDFNINFFNFKYDQID